MLVMLSAAPALAHVTVNPNSAPRGGNATVSFRVPNERDNAATVKLEIVLDSATVIPDASVRPIPGWDAAVTTRTLQKPIKTGHGESAQAVDRITWTATNGTKISAGQFQQFDVSFQQLPDTDTVVLKALQTYDDGSVVRWIDVHPDAENPAPQLHLTKTTSNHHDSKDPAAHGDESHSAEHSEGVSATSVVALVIAGAALLVGSAALWLSVRRRRSDQLVSES
ncbi:MAG: hypothetical protein DLM55_07280 [Acidimicrobiales bacterium]|nr:MAG: hypothetical protein DLM55_07280 [Acidimicrobiales bacterium]